jgi:hypothetical protein
MTTDSIFPDGTSLVEIISPGLVRSRYHRSRMVFVWTVCWDDHRTMQNFFDANMADRMVDIDSSNVAATPKRTKDIAALGLLSVQ